MDESNDAGVNRRDLIKLGAAAAVAATMGTGGPLAALSPAVDQTPIPTRGFFTPEESALVDELSELIVPADDHSPGARAAKVASYIDARLAEAWDEEERLAWRNGLKRIDELARETSGHPFLEASAEQRVALLTRIAGHEKDPRAPEELFFAQLKARVVHAYYTSEIGIKQEMEYKGNSYLSEFVGVDVS